MECLNPAHYNDADVGCGRCIACRINTTRDWALRLNHEAEGMWHNCTFLTLTLDDKHNYDNSVHIDDLSNFFDDIKRKTKIKFKRLGVSEYGESSNRPHYHAVLLGLPPGMDVYQKQWPKGFVASLPYVGSATGNYVAGYVLKKLYGDLAEHCYGIQRLEPPQLRCSNAIGKKWCLEHKDEIIREGLIYDSYGQCHRIPRYYRKLLDLDMSVYMEDRTDMILRHNEKLVRRMHPVTLAKEMSRYHALIDSINKDNYIGYFKLCEFLAINEQKKIARQRRLNTLAAMRQRSM